MENENKKSKKGLVCLLIVILIIAAVLVGGYFYLNSKTSASNIFKTKISEVVNKAGNAEESETIKSEVKISGKLETEKEDYKSIAEMLDGSELAINTQVNFKEKTEKVDLTIVQADKSLLSGNVYYAEGDENIYIYVDGVLNRYFKASLNNIDQEGKAKEALGAIFDTSKFEKINTVKKILNDEINSKLTENYFSQEKVDGLKKSTLKLSIEDLKKIVVEIVEDLQKNEEFLGCYDNPSEIKEELSKIVESLKEIEEEYNKIVLEVSLYTKGLFTQEFVKAEITALNEESTITFYINKVDDQNYEFNLKVTNSENNMTANVETLNGTLKVEKLGENTENVVLNVAVPELGKVTLNISSKLEKNVEIEKVDVSNSVDYANMTQEIATEMLGNINKLPSYNLVKILLSSFLN